MSSEKKGYLCRVLFKYFYKMKNYNTDSTANLSRFARDKRQRISSTERVERSPRPRREADNEGQREFRQRTAAPAKRSFNPHFTDDNRLRSEYTARSERQRPHRESDEEYRRQDGFRSTERGGYHHNENARPHTNDNRRNAFNSTEGGYRQRRDDFRAKGDHRTNGDYRKRDDFRSAEGGEHRSYKGGSNFKKSGAPRRDEKPRSYPKYNPNRQTGEIRLNRFISQSGICSRREADEFILAGVVTVNGKVVTELGTKIMPTDEVRFNDERLQGEKNVYLVLNKPKGYVTTLDDPYADKTVMDLVKNACTERVYPVGRLDKNSLGLLLITNDGDITRQLTHPSCNKKKIYQVTLDKPLTRADMETLTEGITLEDGEIFADEIAYASEDKREVGVEIHSGRNRIVRRMFEHLGYTVQKLDRVYYAGLTKKNLKRGAWRFLTKEEVMRLKTGQYE